MNKVNITVPPQPLPSSQPPPAVPDARPEHSRDRNDFERSLRRLEPSPPATAETKPTAEGKFNPHPNASPERVDEQQQRPDVSDNTDTDDDATPIPGLLPNDDRFLRQGELGTETETVLEVSALHDLSAPAITALESASAGSAIMTLHDFSMLLERTNTAMVSDGEQTWRFTLQDPALAVSQVALTRADAAGHWSVALTLPSTNQTIQNPQLQRLRERLEALGQGITHVIVSREETP